MGGFVDVDGHLTRAAILEKATRKLREVDSGATGWAFGKGFPVRDLTIHVGNVDITALEDPEPEPEPEPEAKAAATETPTEETDGDPQQSGQGRKARNRPAN